MEKLLDLIYIYLLLVILYLKNQHEETIIPIFKDKLVLFDFIYVFIHTFNILLNFIF